MKWLAVLAITASVVAAGCSGGKPAARFPPFSGYLGGAVNESIVLKLPFLYRGRLRPTGVYLDDIACDLIRADPGPESRGLRYGSVLLSLKLEKPTKRSIRTLTVLWSDGHRTRHELGELVLDIRDVPTMPVASYLLNWSPSLDVELEELLFTVEVPNSGEERIEQVDLVYDFPALARQLKSVHASGKPNSPTTRAPLGPGEAKDYRFNLRFVPGQTHKFFVFKPFVATYQSGVATVYSTVAETSYLPAVGESDFADLWEMSR